MAIQTLAVLFTSAAMAGAHFNVERHVLGHEAWRMVERLPDVEKKVISCIYRDDMKKADIAREMNCSKSLIDIVQARALRKLKGAMYCRVPGLTA